jgi:hypothetical protein
MLQYRTLGFPKAIVLLNHYHKSDSMWPLHRLWTVTHHIQQLGYCNLSCSNGDGWMVVREHEPLL